MNNAPTPLYDLSTVGVPNKRTGLPNGIIVFLKFKGTADYRPRVIVSNIRYENTYKDYFALSITDNPKFDWGRPKNFTADEIEAVKSWIVLNKETLLTYWRADGSMDYFDMADNLKSVLP